MFFALPDPITLRGGSPANPYTLKLWEELPQLKMSTFTFLPPVEIWEKIASRSKDLWLLS
jgi:hypothetical protein